MAKVAKCNTTNATQQHFPPPLRPYYNSNRCKYHLNMSLINLTASWQAIGGDNCHLCNKSTSQRQASWTQQFVKRQNGRPCIRRPPKYSIPVLCAPLSWEQMFYTTPMFFLFQRIKQNSTLIGTLISSWNSSRNTPESVILFVPNAPQHTLTAI